MIRLTGSHSTIKYIPYSEAYAEGFEDMERRVPDIRKAKEWFGYQPTRSLNDIIRDVIADKRQQNGNPNGMAVEAASSAAGHHS